MKFFPRLLFLTAILLVVLGLSDQRSGDTDNRDRIPWNTESVIDGAGLLPIVHNDPPVPTEYKHTGIRKEFSGNSLLSYEHYLLTRFTLLIKRIKSAYKNRSPELIARTGQWIHTGGDIQTEDPSRS